MKYILLMSGTQAGVGTYLAWSQKDRDAHMAVLQNIGKELTGSGEFVATQGLAAPSEAKVVRSEGGHAGDRRHFSGSEGIPPRLLDRGCGQSGTRLRHSGANFGGTGPWRRADKHAD